MSSPSPRGPDSKLAMAPAIAVVGCDGAGKSTLTADLFEHLNGKLPIEYHYLGQSSGNIARAISRLPLIGAPLQRFLVNKAKRAHGAKKSPPGAATALVFYLLSLWRAYKFRRMLALRRRGVAIITDRYPQAEVPGFYFDGPGLPALSAQGWLARWLVPREKRLYQRMAQHVPDLVIRLSVDAETAHARKPDHSLAMLRDKVAVIPVLRFNGARIVDLDGCSPYPQVLASALEAVHSSLGLAKR